MTQSMDLSDDEDDLDGSLLDVAQENMFVDTDEISKSAN